jgi:hypothetical protein
MIIECTTIASDITIPFDKVELNYWTIILVTGAIQIERKILLLCNFYNLLGWIDR